MYKTLLGLILTGLLGVNVAVAAKTPMVAIAVSPDKSVTIVLYDTPCAGKVAGLIDNPEALAKSKTSKVTVNGRALEACWMAGDEVIGLILENGQTGEIPMAYFEKAEAV